jgi:hypothetical protein
MPQLEYTWQSTYQNNREEHLLVNLHGFLIPLPSIRGPAVIVFLVINGGVMITSGVYAAYSGFQSESLTFIFNLENSRYIYI